MDDSEIGVSDTKKGASNAAVQPKVNNSEIGAHYTSGGPPIEKKAPAKNESKSGASIGQDKLHSNSLFSLSLLSMRSIFVCADSGSNEKIEFTCRLFLFVYINIL